MQPTAPSRKMLVKQWIFILFGIYTIPEISYIGETEESLKEKGIEYEVGKGIFLRNI